MATAIKQSRSGYYAWCNRPLSPRGKENETLSQMIQQIQQESRQTYGSPRIQAALAAQGFPISRQRVIRLMANLGINAHLRRKFKGTTDSNHRLPIAENTLDRCFKTDASDQVWVADITYIWTAEGWVYLAVILDLFSRRVVGWSIAEHLRTELVLTALSAALGHRKPSSAGLLFHSDRGSQYASHDYQQALRQANIACSISRRGNCWDNAVAERFFGTIKTELIHPTVFPNRAIARTTIVEWIEVFYNRKRLHSTLGFLSPAQFEDQYYRSLISPISA
ncbi:IS3 family transposase [Candidatus Synechococcus calcipolaris G9]|uniref:IS3 family transposase n=1 Tax=Candidatus Synechococcus calcipolaris G9 TaxID=1497997 RepID=A0ABT6F2G2_9SYNE|nr:IS3 family transposase [Candidatus Synechococcus calcipolaris]MDG2991966.1 IS3 family transposase [Candidatus Synechococcus calcipolaris G9]